MTNSRAGKTTIVSDTITSDWTTTSTTLEDVTAFALTLPALGKFIAVMQASVKNSSSNDTILQLEQNSSVIGSAIASHNQDPNGVCLAATGTSDGTALKVQGKVSAGTGTLYGTADGNQARLEVFSVQ